MRAGVAAVVSVTLALTCALLLGGRTAEAAAPPLQLPWPTNHQHRINGGSVYNCYLHTTQTASSGGAYNADYYAIDFQFGSVDGSPLDIAAVSGGTVEVAANHQDGYGYKVVIDHGGGYYSVYAHMSSFGQGIYENASVGQGQFLGYAGNSGGQYPVHLHMHMQSGLSAYKPEPMSRVTGFDQYDWCDGNPPSPYWASWPPYAAIEGALVKGSGSAIYILSGGQKRHIASAGAFNACGYRWNEVSIVNDATLSLTPSGSNVTGPPCPFTLATSGGAVYHMWGNYFKRGITSPGAFNACQYDWGDIVTVSSLSGFTSTTPISGPPCPYTRDPWYHEATMDGSLVKGSGPAVYVLSGGKKRHIVSATLFNTCGYEWNDVVAVSDSTLSLIPNGSSVTSAPCPYTLIQRSSGGAVYVMLATLKKGITSPGVFNACGYVWGDIVTLSQAAVGSVTTGVPLSAPPCPYVRQ